jgi:hypothetical protein
MMQWGFDASPEALKLCYGTDVWYDTSAISSYKTEREEGQYYVKGDVLWHVQGDTATRNGTDTYTIHNGGIITVSRDALYVCDNKTCYMASENDYKYLCTFAHAPTSIIYSESGLLCRTGVGFYTPAGTFLARDLDLFDTDKGVFVGVTSWCMKIWFTASWQMHHRISIPGKAIDVSCTAPWVCVVTRKNTCSIWNIRTGEAYRQWSITSPRSVSIDHAAAIGIPCG